MRVAHGAAEILVATRDQRLLLLAYRPESDAAAATHPDRANIVELARATSLAPAHTWRMEGVGPDTSWVGVA
jgi:hypothetical protein